MRPLGAAPLVLLCQVLGAWAACTLAPDPVAASGPPAPPQRSRLPPAPPPLAPGRRAAATLPVRGALPPGGAAGPGGSCAPRGAPGTGRRRARSSEPGAGAAAGRGGAGGPRWLPLNGSAGGEGSAGGRGNATGRRARLRNPFYPLTEESYGAYAVMCLSVVIFGIGIMGNMAVMCIVCHNYYMRSISNSLLANLAFWDFLIVFFCLPLVIFQELTKKWLLEDFSCKIVPYIEVTSVGGDTRTPSSSPRRESEPCAGPALLAVIAAGPGASRCALVRVSGVLLRRSGARPGPAGSGVGSGSTGSSGTGISAAPAECVRRFLPLARLLPNFPCSL